MTKRLIDISAALLGLVVLLPVLSVLALLIWRDVGRPILFRQTRPGKDGRPFEMIKFRTMCDAFGEDGQPLADADRITAMGRKLRSTSADELPELWNVLKGDMSIVGPRPLLMEYLPLYTNEQSRRHEVRPGITGWAQVNGRNAITWKDKLALDVWYVDNRSLWLDLKIILMTVRKVLVRADMSTDGDVNVSKFTGD